MLVVAGWTTDGDFVVVRLVDTWVSLVGLPTKHSDLLPTADFHCAAARRLNPSEIVGPLHI